MSLRAVKRVKHSIEIARKSDSSIVSTMKSKCQTMARVVPAVTMVTIAAPVVTVVEQSTLDRASCWWRGSDEWRRSLG